MMDKACFYITDYYDYLCHVTQNDFELEHEAAKKPTHASNVTISQTHRMSVAVKLCIL